MTTNVRCNADIDVRDIYYGSEYFIAYVGLYNEGALEKEVS